ncbi:phosphatase PAP2 family protein [Vallicoccus soli]|uniref:Phosphatase PAP2 family protein n=1 Tax=Vallicoccus soli TaxID=2339232 RepID=A0A3A3YW38_9ACTN|nr:phosphatase PAP2 family protein [Vallicoccus soli]RJK94897.1 phosphatase PAP2 family protein [Vallicoccus soli]
MTTTGGQVERETRRAVRLAAGAGAGAVAALPFLLVLALVGAGWGPLGDLDRGVADALNRWALERPGVVDALDVLAEVLHPSVFRTAGAVLAVTAWLRGARVLGWWVAAVTAVSGVLVPVLKELVGRARPAFEQAVAVETSQSFPSGHATASFVGAAVLLAVALPLLGRAGRAVAWALAVAVVLVTGFDRVALGVHYVSDVVGGWLLGAAVVVGATVALGSPLLSPLLDPLRSRRTPSAP